jgi:hypothetical protein
MNEKGMSASAVIDEMMDIEIELLRFMAARKSKEQGPQ